MTKVKICGITQLENARAVAECGADMIGLNFYKKSPRYIDPEVATTIANTLRAELGDRCPVLVGVFVNELVSNISQIMGRVGLDFAQLSGDESIDMLRELPNSAFKSIQPLNIGNALDDVTYFEPSFVSDTRAPSILVDAYHPNLKGGTGAQTSVEVALSVKVRVPRLMLAGGLNDTNVGERVRQIHPWGVDVASGVESGIPGIKDIEKVKAFITAVNQI